MMYFVDRRDLAIPLFIDANILLLTFLYYESTSNLHPSNILNLFQKTSNIHTLHGHPPPGMFMLKAPDCKNT